MYQDKITSSHTQTPSEEDMSKRQDIVAEARKYMNVRWKHQGRNPKDGIDCAGLIVLTAKALGLSDYDYTNYTRRPTGDFVKHFDEHMERKPFHEVQEGDVLILRDGVYSCHCGFATFRHGTLHILHGYFVAGKVIEQPWDSNLMAKLTRVYQFHGVD